MENFSIRYIYDRKNETTYRGEDKKKEYKEVGLLQLEVRVEKTSKRVFISTEIKIKPNQYSDKNGFTCKNHTQAKAITLKAKRIFDSVYEFVSSDKCNSIDSVKFWNHKKFNDSLFIPYIEELNRKKDISLGILKYHITLRNQLIEFGQIKTFQDITYSNIVEFDEHMKDRKINNSTRRKRHSILRWYISEAIKMDLFSGKNPYDLFKIPKVNEVDTTYLLESELQKIQDFQPNMSYLEKVKDLFLFQCYTGLAYVDLMNFEASNIEEVGGRLVIKDSRQKTDVNFIIPILPDAKTILDKYNNELPKITNQRYNKYLKELATAVGIDKTITTHVARHIQNHIYL